jgi:hypothetical protein
LLRRHKSLLLRRERKRLLEPFEKCVWGGERRERERERVQGRSECGRIEAEEEEAKQLTST